MKQASHKNRTFVWALSALVLGGAGFLAAARTADPEPAGLSSSKLSEDNRFIGAKKCKSCHKSDESGNQYGAWENARHSKAFETLASDAAKKVASEKGIADPQKADECLRCHVTAHGAEDSAIKRGFKAEMGVQCETCHGPGEQHMAARFADAAAEKADAKPAPGEIIASPTKATCKQCHNEQSPTAKPFCFHDSALKIAHPRPERAQAIAAAGIADCSSCHSTGAELKSPQPEFCVTCHDPVPERK